MHHLISTLITCTMTLCPAAQSTARFELSDQSQAAYPALADDLVNAGQLTLKAVYSEGYAPRPGQFGDVTVINDGEVGGATVPADGMLQTDGTYGLVFELNTERHPQGYDLEELRIIAAWPQQRSAQKVAISVRLIGQSNFQQLGEFAQLPFTPSMQSASLLTVSGEPLARGAAAVRVRFLPHTDQAGSNYGVYREVDVVGQPSIGAAEPAVFPVVDEAHRLSQQGAEVTETLRQAARDYVPFAGAPTVDTFLTHGIPTQDPDTLLFPYDAPAITNNLLWAQAVNNEKRSGVLDMEDVWLGPNLVDGTMRYTMQGIWNRYQPLLSTLVVRVNGEPLKPPPVEKADWMPNTVIRYAEAEGLKFTGTVKAAAGYTALLNRLDVKNPTSRPISIDLEFVTGPASGAVALIPEAPKATTAGQETQHIFQNLTLKPGEKRIFGVVLAYGDCAEKAQKIGSDLGQEWALADAYWNALLADAYNPEPGPLLSGGVPLFQTADKAEQRLYDFGLVTALMVMTKSVQKVGETNLYLVAIPDAPYTPWVYFWDSSYASEVITLLDPAAMRQTLLLMCGSGIQGGAAFDSKTGKPAAQWYAANFASFLRMLSVYIDWTGDDAVLDERVKGKSVLEHVLAASEYNDNRPQRDGLFHAKGEHHLFDRNTVKGYEHYVAWPNMADAWAKREIARLLEARGEQAQAQALREKADARAQAVIDVLYNDAPGYEGTWKQIHEDGKVLQIRHGIDFMHAGMSLTDELSTSQKQAMRDWWAEQILARSRPEDVWVISQDRRDGNNGPHQMEHNGQGAYPGWPYHYAWSLHAMGYDADVQALLNKITGIVRMGAIGQGYSRDGRRSRSGWAEIAGAFPVPFIINFLFGVQADGDSLSAEPLPTIETTAKLSGLRWRGGVYDVNADGQVEQQ